MSAFYQTLTEHDFCRQRSSTLVVRNRLTQNRPTIWLPSLWRHAFNWKGFHILLS